MFSNRTNGDVREGARWPWFASASAYRDQNITLFMVAARCHPIRASLRESLEHDRFCRG